MNKYCFDCGTAPIWWRNTSKCRRCSDKGGERYLSIVEIDVDKILDYFHGDIVAAENFIKDMEVD